MNVSSPVSKTVLVVEDDTDQLMLISSVLHQSGLKVLSALNCEQAISVLSENRDVAVIVTDIRIPGGGGEYLLQTVRNSEDFSHLPVIAMSATSVEAIDWIDSSDGPDLFCDKKDVRNLLAKQIQQLL